ncbi:UvrD-helicase domain-containing protein [Coraliomargarita parva]|uniref:UvrD-helicase domain-containing protein n=1 Tax=Coraliomargarita parva TaxID=3014050 RepID=UPI0022B2CB8D|nr:UvrD-helicase domain-containing protein [Coraliomargarita parva]
MNELQHIAISASAGSGKTYQLTNRFIYLLHLAEAPERIIALTFTRTAAGEFFHKIVEKLCEAASDAGHAAQLSEDLGITADTGRYHELLKLLIRRMHKLNLQTLDSFFFQVVSAFALELGLSGTLNLLDETSEPRARNEVRDSIVHRSGEMNTELQEFWHAFKQATYGHEQRSVERIVSSFIEALYSLYLEAPEAERWGEPDTIWPTGCPWKSKTHPDWDALADQLLAALPDGISKSQLGDFETVAQKVRSYPVEEKLNTLLSRAFAQADEILSDRTVLQCGRGKNNQLPLSGSACQALADILKGIVWHHLHRALQNTQGVYRILKAYHENYDRLVRRSGKLAFSDLTHLLSPANSGSPLQKVDPENRELMDFRLDGHYDHWLFDEFQDTSRTQWEAVENLVSEIVQDPSGQRSLFYVGDTKQCLYLWRNSDDRLFHEILNDYRPTIHEQKLSTSWRSAPAILDAVNEVFDDGPLIEASFSPAVATRWVRAWQPHEASPTTRNLSGYACWLHSNESEGPSRNELLLQILQELQPLEKGMTVGILVRKNAAANEIADYLREHSNLPVHTGSAVQPASDNAAGVTLLAMLRLAAHPGDAHPRGLLKLIDQSTPGAPLESAAPELRRRLLTESSAEALAWAADQIKAHLPKNDRRHDQRLSLLVEAARKFDNEERRDLDSLHQYLAGSSTGETETGDSIIIETVHKSKGLEYDVVLLVEEETRSSMQLDRNISAFRNEAGKPEWLLEPLKKDLMETDTELRKLKEQAESQGGFGALCGLYVAMTRARRGLYIISDPKGANKGSLVKFLGESLGDTAEPKALFEQACYPLAWECGDMHWHRSFQVRSRETGEASPPEPSRPYRPSHPRLQLARPSSGKSRQFKAGNYFDLNETSANFGTEVHAVFEQVEWLEGDAPDFHASSEAVAAVEACFGQADIRKLFRQPDGGCELWRERAFSLVQGTRFYNGVFDRVHLHKDSTGRITHAAIIDFKTDRINEPNTVSNAAEQHRHQLEDYRNALSRITGVDPKAIRLVLVFTDIPALKELN